MPNFKVRDVVEGSCADDDVADGCHRVAQLFSQSREMEPWKLFLRVPNSHKAVICTRQRATALAM